MIAQRYGLNRDTFSSWVYRERKSSDFGKSNKLTSLSQPIKKGDILPESIESRIKDLEHKLSVETMRSECLSKMIEIAERELKIDIRKNTGAKQSMR
jgi:hypothetical protein